MTTRRGLAPGDAQPALPTGTDLENIGNWEDWNGVTSRLCWSRAVPMPDHLLRLDIRAVVPQLTDGSVVDGPLVYLGENGWSLSDAHLIAQALITAADMGERMVCAPTKVSAL